MNVLLDNIIFSLQKVGGVSLVWSEHLKRIIEDRDFNLKCIEYDNNNFFRDEITYEFENIIKEGFKRPLFIERYINPKPRNFKGIFHSSYYRFVKDKKVCNVTTVHDFTYEYFRKGIPKLIHSYQKMNAINNSEKIICISENTKSDLLRFNPKINEEKIEVIYNGVDEIFKVNNNLNLLKTLIPFGKNEYLLYIGSRGANHKNFDTAVKASKIVNMPLVIVGGGQLTPEEKHYLDSELKCGYKTLLGVSNGHLNVLYGNAFCFLYPSLYEGFGLPVVEAQNSGCPVITSNTSSLSEVTGAGGILIDNINGLKLGEAIKFLINNDKERTLLIDKGLKNGQRFSWDLCYQKTKEVYKKII